jgi:hypothetical protein
LAFGFLGTGQKPPILGRRSWPRIGDGSDLSALSRRAANGGVKTEIAPVYVAPCASAEKHTRQAIL